VIADLAVDGDEFLKRLGGGSVAPSQILRKLASYPRQNELAAALREVGCVERTLFML
jgi:TnpA family transposase